MGWPGSATRAMEIMHTWESQFQKKGSIASSALLSAMIALTVPASQANSGSHVTLTSSVQSWASAVGREMFRFWLKNRPRAIAWWKRINLNRARGVGPCFEQAGIVRRRQQI
jgi:hypothetical protein